jgi:hypothetical protein
MRGAPQVGFSWAIRAMRSRTSLSNGGRPARFVRDFQRHHRRKTCRCQRITVSGWTRTRAERQLPYSFVRQTQNSRSRRRRVVAVAAG